MLLRPPARFCSGFLAMLALGSAQAGPTDPNHPLMDGRGGMSPLSLLAGDRTTRVWRQQNSDAPCVQARPPPRRDPAQGHQRLSRDVGRSGRGGRAHRGRHRPPRAEHQRLWHHPDHRHGLTATPRRSEGVGNYLAAAKPNQTLRKRRTRPPSRKTSALAQRPPTVRFLWDTGCDLLQADHDPDLHPFQSVIFINVCTLWISKC